MAAHTDGTGLRGVSAAAADAWERAEARAEAAEQEAAQLAEHLREAREEAADDRALLDWMHGNVCAVTVRDRHGAERTYADDISRDDEDVRAFIERVRATEARRAAETTEASHG